MQAVERHIILPGDSGIMQTVGHIRRLIDRGRSDLRIRRLAESILSGYNLNRLSEVSILQAFHNHVQKNLSYLPDPVDVEFVRSAPSLLDDPYGDCDDFTVLLGSLAESVGIPVDLRVIDTGDGLGYSHIYPVAVLSDGSQLALDASDPDISLGYEYPKIERYKDRESTMQCVYAHLLRGLGVEDDTETLIEQEMHPLATNGWEDRMLKRAEGSLKPVLTGFEKIKLCNYAETHRYLYGSEAVVEICKLVARSDGSYDETVRGKVVPNGVFTEGEIPTLTKLDKYGVRNWVWPGTKSTTDPTKQARLVVSAIDVIIGDMENEQVYFRWQIVPLSDIPAEPFDVEGDYGYEVIETETEAPEIYIIPEDTEIPEIEIEEPEIYIIPEGAAEEAIDTCSEVDLGAGQLILNKGVLNKGDTLSTIWAARFASTSPVGKTDIELQSNQRWALVVVDVTACSDTQAVYTAEYQLQETEIVSEPEIIYQDQTEYVEDVVTGEIPTAVWIGAGVLAFLALTRSGK